jgi:hypothetical protein
MYAATQEARGIAQAARSIFNEAVHGQDMFKTSDVAALIGCVDTQIVADWCRAGMFGGPSHSQPFERYKIPSQRLQAAIIFAAPH